MRSALFIGALIVGISSFAAEKSDPNLYTCKGEDLRVTMSLRKQGDTLEPIFNANIPVHGEINVKGSNFITPEINLVGVRFWVKPDVGNLIYSFFVPLIYQFEEDVSEFDTVISVTDVPEDPEEQAQKVSGVLVPTTFYSLHCVAQRVLLE